MEADSSNGQMCEWLPASSHATLVAALLQQEAGSAAGRAMHGNDSARREVEMDRPPLRVIRDTYPTYSAVAIDPARNEIVLQDENLFQILVYDRSSNTPPTAGMSAKASRKIISGAYDCRLALPSAERP